MARRHEGKEEGIAATAREAAASAAAAAEAAAEAAAANERLAEALTAASDSETNEVQKSAPRGSKHPMGTEEHEVRDEDTPPGVGYQVSPYEASSPALADVRRHLAVVQANSERNAVLLARLRERRET